MSGFKNLCNKLVDLLPEGDEKFGLKMTITGGVFAYVSVNLTRSKAHQWVENIQQWLRMQYFCMRDLQANVMILALILSDVPKKSNHN